MTEQKRVLLADDARFFLEVHRDVLEQAGLAVLLAHTGEEAYAMIQAQRPDLVILDYHMPNLQGDEVCARIKRDPDLQEIPVIMVTADREPEAIERCLDAGCNDFLLKPFKPGELLKKTQLLLDFPFCQYTRIRVRFRLKGRRELGLFVAHSIDLSEGGMLIETGVRLHAGETLTLRFQLPRAQYRITAEAEVVREGAGEENPRYGVKFLSLDSPSQQAIRQFIVNHVTH